MEKKNYSRKTNFWEKGKCLGKGTYFGEKENTNWGQICMGKGNIGENEKRIREDNNMSGKMRNIPGEMRNNSGKRKTHSGKKEHISGQLENVSEK